jgi:site-specific DNA recombinase
MQESPSIKRIALYARVSSEEQKEGQTIDSQIAELQRHASERSWIVAGIYKDDGWSGGLLARPELDRLRDDASKALFDAVLVNDVDRLARDVTHLGVIKRSLERSGIALIFRKLPAETSPMRNLMVNILGSFAEFERELIADRTRRGRRHKAEVRKQFIGCLPPYGYDYIDRSSNHGEGILRVNQEEALVVKRMYSWVDKERLSARGVVQRLNQTGLRPRKGAPQWAKSSVVRILRRQTYAGIWHYNKHESFEPSDPQQARRYRRTVKTSLRLRDRKEWIAVPLPAQLCLINPDMWLRVQARLNQNISFSPRNARHSYLLRGLVRCAGCRARFVGDPSHGKFYYRCHRRCKKVGTILESHLDDAVWKALQEAILSPELIVKSVTALQARKSKQPESYRIQSVSAAKLLDQLRSEELRILDAYRLAIISAEQLDRELRQLALRRKAVEENKNTDMPRHGQSTSFLSESGIRQEIAGFCARVAKRLYSLTVEEKQWLLRSVIDEIVFDGAIVLIRGIIPYGQNVNGITTGRANGLSPADGGIENTAGHYSVHNLDDAYEGERGKIAFEITRQVKPAIPTAA